MRRASQSTNASCVWPGWVMPGQMPKSLAGSSVLAAFSNRQPSQRHQDAKEKPAPAQIVHERKDGEDDAGQHAEQRGEPIAADRRADRTEDAAYGAVGLEHRHEDGKQRLQRR